MISRFARWLVEFLWLIRLSTKEILFQAVISIITLSKRARFCFNKLPTPNPLQTFGLHGISKVKTQDVVLSSTHPSCKSLSWEFISNFSGDFNKSLKINEKFLRTSELRLDFFPIIKPFGIFSSTESQKCEYLDNKGQETTSHPTSLASIYFGFFHINTHYNIIRL